MGRSSIGNDRWLTCGVEGALLDIECEIDTGDATAVTLRCEVRRSTTVDARTGHYSPLDVARVGFFRSEKSGFWIDNRG